MTLYTSKVIADWLGLTERRVRQLRDEGVITETRPGLYALRPTVRRYIEYLRKGSSSLVEERTALTKAKREAVEMENAVRQGLLLEASDIEKGIKTSNLNIRSRFLALPAKLSPSLAAKGGDQTAIFDELQGAIHEVLAELSDYRNLLAKRSGEDEEAAND